MVIAQNKLGMSSSARSFQFLLGLSGNAVYMALFIYFSYKVIGSLQKATDKEVHIDSLSRYSPFIAFPAMAFF